jgi:hypothetical protein
MGGNDRTRQRDVVMQEEVEGKERNDYVVT